MKLVETLKNRTGALKVVEVAKLFGVTPQHIYKMAASGSIPSFRISGSVRFDPDEVAAWLKEKQAPVAASRRIGSQRVAAYFLCLSLADSTSAPNPQARPHAATHPLRHRAAPLISRFPSSSPR
jgi:excisionase family DNA binding protein